jgi:hypothetical protein
MNINFSLPGRYYTFFPFWVIMTSFILYPKHKKQGKEY